MSDETNIELPKRKRNPDDAEPDITPMIDVTFLLLAFFVVVSNMDPQKAMDLPKASYGVSIPDKNCVTLLVKPDESGESYLIYKGRSMDEKTVVPAGEPDDIESVIGDYVEDELSKDPSIKYIMIKAEGDVTTGTVEMVKRGVARSGLAADRKLVMGVEEER
jgi:biopolymer transport protein ExbD